jgi:hypothetical protein
MRSRFLLAAVALLALAVPSLAQQQDVQVGQLAYRYDLDSTTLTFCRLVGNRQDVYASPIAGRDPIATVGTSATVTAVSGTPFSSVGVGDVLISNQPDGVNEIVIVTAKASSTSVTVDPAVDWENGGAGFPFSWYDLQCGTGAEDGWVASPPGQHASVLLTVQYEAGDLTGGLDVVWQGRGANLGAEEIQLYPGGGSDCGGFATLSTDVCTLATADVGTVKGRLAFQVEPNNYQEVRVGIKANTADPGDPTTEEINVTVTAVR